MDTPENRIILCLMRVFSTVLASCCINAAYALSYVFVFGYSQTCVKRPYKTRHTCMLAFQTCGCLLLNESSPESSAEVLLLIAAWK